MPKITNNVFPLSGAFDVNALLLPCDIGKLYRRLPETNDLTPMSEFLMELAEIVDLIDELVEKDDAQEVLTAVFNTICGGNATQRAFCVLIHALVLPFFIYLLLLHSVKHTSQRLNRRNRGLVLVTSWSKELILFKVCKG